MLLREIITAYSEDHMKYIYILCKQNAKFLNVEVGNHEDVWGSRGIALCILDLVITWRLMVSTTPQFLYSRVKSPQYPLDGRLGGPQNWSGCYGEEKNLLPLLGIKLQFLGRPAHSLVTILTELSRLLTYTRRFLRVQKPQVKLK
jgi:hypothetical protein